MIPLAPIALAAALFAGPSGSASADVPALIAKPTAESRAEIARLVSRALRGAAVSLADDAFVRESALVVERARPRAIEGAPAVGREARRPDHFRLVKSGRRCVLVHEESGQRFSLVSTACSRQ
jgi:hypothetical protein